MWVVYLVAVGKAVLTESISLIGTESVPPHRLCSILLHTDAMLHSHNDQCRKVCEMPQYGRGHITDLHT